MRILIAEDDTASRLILEATLGGLGHEIISAKDGEQAWRMFQSEKVEAIISDREMPGLNGVDLCRRIRASKGGLEVCVVAGERDLLQAEQGRLGGGLAFRPRASPDRGRGPYPAA